MKPPTAPLKPKTILIPVDNSSQAEDAVRSIRALSLPERVLLVHTISVPQFAYPGTGMSVGHDFSGAAEKALREEGIRILEKASSLLPPECRNVESGSPSSVIQEQISRLQPQLVLMRTAGRSPLQRLAHGSVSHATIHHAPCSVLLIREPPSHTQA